MVLLDLAIITFPITNSSTPQRATPPRNLKPPPPNSSLPNLGRSTLIAFMAASTTTLLLTSPIQSTALQFQDSQPFSNIPPSLSGECPPNTTCKKPLKIQRPKSRKAETCTVKCLNTCIRGGEGSPGEGPFTIRRPIVVFKKGFRSRQYCLSECSDICNLLGDRDDGP